MMTIRLFSQWWTFCVSLLILLMALASMYLRPDRRWLLALVVFYASIDIVFYVIVLIIGLRAFGSEISPYRSVMQSAIVFALIFRYMRGDFLGWFRRWK